MERMRFRILAPEAAQRTSFQKYRGTNARAIVDAIALDVEYASLVRITHRITLYNYGAEASNLQNYLFMHMIGPIPPFRERNGLLNCIFYRCAHSIPTRMKPILQPAYARQKAASLVHCGEVDWHQADAQ